FQQLDLRLRRQRNNRVHLAVKRDGQLRCTGFHFSRLTCGGNRAHGARGVLQRVEADLVGGGEGGLLARYGAHADALLDVEAARLDDALFQAPALEARVLEVEVGEIDAVRAEDAEHALEFAFLEIERFEQRLRCRFQNQTNLLRNFNKTSF